jgi:hypothetical protein
LYAKYFKNSTQTPPTERIAAYVQALLARYPDIPDEDDYDESAEDLPWSSGPLIRNASGPLFYFGLITNRTAEEAWAFAVETADAHGLVCFDPQKDGLATPEGT